ncbi:hypothetical protein [Cerasicoccus frondis]|uniref:hypothetical protein n=1 Tax=Cerasicoccus frondis TaxID=490090 RepID=UPI00285253B8|nr:hypothetical protein [Cerasicoccus frondis]
MRLATITIFAWFASHLQGDILQLFTPQEFSVVEGYNDLSFIQVPNVTRDFLIYLNADNLYVIPERQSVATYGYDPASSDYIMLILDGGKFAYFLLVRVKNAEHLVLAELLPQDLLLNERPWLKADVHSPKWWNAEMGWLLFSVARTTYNSETKIYSTRHHYELWDAYDDKQLFIFDANLELSDAVVHCNNWAATGGLPREALLAPGVRAEQVNGMSQADTPQP